LTASNSQASNTRFGKKMKNYHRLLEVLFPPARAEILRLLFLPPRKDRYVRELMRESGLTLCAIQDELRKLSALQLVTSWSNRYHRFYRANREHPIFVALVQIVQNSEQIPRVSHSCLHRRVQRTKRPKPRQLPPDRPISWDLFSKPRKS
jgi:predicted transcriptional regulator